MIYKNQADQTKAALKSMLENFDLSQKQYDDLMRKVEQQEEQSC